MLDKTRFEIPRNCPAHIVDMINKTNRAADKLYCLESNLSRIDWHDFDDFEYQLEEARKACAELSEQTRHELRKWRDEQRTDNN